MSLIRKAKQLGASAIYKSNRKFKKYYVIYDGKPIHFGDSRYDDFTMHKDLARRKRYRKRAGGIKDSKGKLTYLNKYSPNFWSYHLLW